MDGKNEGRLNNKYMFNREMSFHPIEIFTEKKLPPTLCGQSTTRGPKRRNEAVISSAKEIVNRVIKPRPNLKI